jgi:MFS family permease
MRISTGALAGVLRDGPFRNFWIGFTLSGVGDAMTKTALVWYVYETTGSAPAVGLLLLVYAGPVTVGGLVAGYLLDRFDRRRVMLADSVLRGLVVASVPVAAALGHLELWHVYVAAGLYGFLFMIGLAGAPTLIPALVDDDKLTAANSLETLGFTVSGVAGPALAGLLIAGIGAPYVLAVDAASYVFFAIVLATMKLRPEGAHPEEARSGEVDSDAVGGGTVGSGTVGSGAVSPEGLGEDALPGRSYRLADAFRLLLRNPVLLSTTVMFMCFNAGEGFLSVWLPLHTGDIAPAHGAQLYGVLLAVLAVGETLGALGGGVLSGSMSEGRMICLAQLLAGLSLALALFGGGVWTTAPALFLLGFFSAPMTAWAQTLRMRVIPPGLRGRSFALLRTLMQSSSPAFSGIGGVLLPAVGVTAMIGLSAALIAVPGAVGSRVRALVDAGARPDASRDAADRPVN